MLLYTCAYTHAHTHYGMVEGVLFGKYAFVSVDNLKSEVLSL